MFDPSLIQFTTTQTTLTVGKYTFLITDNTNLYDGRISCRYFMIGGEFWKCLHVFIDYKDELPVSACIPDNSMYTNTIFADDESPYQDNCLDQEGFIVMFRTLMNHVHTQLPSITKVDFHDKTHMDCETEHETFSGGTYLTRLSVALYDLSIAFNGKTWFEHYFHARMKDADRHRAYRARVDQLLHSSELKAGIPFNEFIYSISVVIGDVYQWVAPLQPSYDASATFGEFFQAMPRADRCRLVRYWISYFMKHHLGDVFSHSGWVLDLPLSDAPTAAPDDAYYCPQDPLYGVLYERFYYRFEALTTADQV